MIAARDSQRLNLWMHGWGLEVDVTPLRSEKRVVVNFLRWPGMRAYVDGEKCAASPTTGNESSCWSAADIGDC